MEARIVIRNGLLARVGAGATIVIEGRRIARVSPPGSAVEGRPGDWDVDADGRLVIPGAIDAHTHLALGGLFRLAGLPGRAPPTVSDLRAGFRGPLEDRSTPRLLEPLVRAGALASLRAGVTCVFDIMRGAAGTAAELLAAEARALGAIGVRATVAYGARGERGGRAGGADEVRAAAAFADRHSSHHLLRGAVGLAGLADASEEALEMIAAHAPGAGLHACIGEDESDLAHSFARWGRRPVEVLAVRGLLSPRTVVAHACTAAHSEAAALAESKAVLALAPRAAMFWGAPMPPLATFAGLGVAIAFGTDGLFPCPASEAVTAAMVLRNAERTAGAAAPLVGGVAWPAAAQLASTFFGDRIGTLEEGALADVVVLDWRPRVPLPDVPDGDLALLWAGAPAAWAIVDGEVRLREGRLLGVDEAEIAACAREASAALLAA